MTSRYLHVDPVSRVKHPGDGFYQYVNEKWLETSHIDPSKSENSAFVEIDSEITKDLVSILNDLPLYTGRNPIDAKEHLSALKSVYQSRSIITDEQYLKLCLDQVIQSSDYEIAKFFGWLSFSRIPSIMNHTIQEETVKPYFVRSSLISGGLSLPIEYYTKPKHQKGPVWKAYVNFVHICSIELGLPFLRNVIDAELELSKINTMRLNEEVKSIKGSSLVRLMPDFEWEGYMDGLQIRGWQTRTWAIDCPERIEQILGWVCKANKEKVVALFAYHLILQSIDFLSPKIKDAAEHVFRRELMGIHKQIPAKEEFLSIAKDVLPDAICSVYAKTQNNPEKVRDLTEMTESIQGAAVKLMRDTNLLSKKTKAKAIEKIHRMTFQIGSGSRSDTNLDLDLVTYSDSILQTILSIQQSRSRSMLKYTGKPARKSGPYPCFIVNASYYMESNRIVIPWGILHWPFYDHRASIGWNYGGTGTTLGHEITHAFDLDGSQYSPRAVAKDWWTRKDKRKFKERTRKVSKFYSRFTHYGLHLNGNRTVSEDWADLGGMQITLNALKARLDRIGVSEDIRKQEIRTFFIAYAVSWRKLMKKKKIIFQILTDLHTPAIDRVDRIVPHFQEWVDAFDIKETDKLFIPKEKRLKTF